MRLEEISMRSRHRKLLTMFVLIAAGIAASASAMAERRGQHPPLMIEEQGSFTAGGKVITEPGTFDPLGWNVSTNPPAGQTLHCDHAYASYQIPVKARKLPLVMWHGNEGTGETWETTPDGREGFQSIFLRRGFPVYLIDQPRRGRAGRSCAPIALTPPFDDQSAVFGLFRIGVWPNYFPGVAFRSDPETWREFNRWRTPNTGPFDMAVLSDGVMALFDKIGPGILITHSQGGGPGWLTAMKTDKVRAIVSFEPGSSFVFPEGELPTPIFGSFDTLAGRPVPPADFLRLTKIPILLIYGDNIPETPTASPGQDAWRVRLQMARVWRDALNSKGGDVTVIHLPQLGIRGNTHFPFADLNNVQVADVMSRWLKDKRLDSRTTSTKQTNRPQRRV